MTHIKEVISDDFNKNKNYENIMARLHASKTTNENRKYPTKLIPVFLALVIVVGGAVYTFEHNSFVIDGDKIVINKISDISASDLAAESKIDGELLDGVDKNSPIYVIINNLSMPSDLTLEQSGTIWVSSDINKLSAKNYDLLHDYYFSYSDSNVGKERKANISVSYLGQPLRDYYIVDDNDKPSIINNMEVYIASGFSMHICEFQYKDLYFDIETRDLTDEEVVSILKSIIK